MLESHDLDDEYLKIIQHIPLYSLAYTSRHNYNHEIELLPERLLVSGYLTVAPFNHSFTTSLLSFYLDHPRPLLSRSGQHTLSLAGYVSKRS